MPNQLSTQTSLYLLQHSQQPVEWFPWSESVFELAKKQDKPILISIGYSACHWCHKMSEESFSDSYIASIMNRHFICVKVDREERPDIDQTYLEAIHMFNQSAGWPLHVFCLPDGRPFWGGTYFPKEDENQGIVPWPLVLMRIAEHYKRKKEELIENAENVTRNLIHSNDSNYSIDKEWKNDDLIIAAESICKSHDNQNGGFTPAPKFPSPMKIDFLLAIRESQALKNNPSIGIEIDQCVQKTLTKMANGGIFDQLEGGFFRYSVDSEWQNPHFEKMLYDNALLLSTYSKAYQRFSNPLFKEIVTNTISWLNEKMTENQHGYFSSVSAFTNEGEGEYYLCSYDSIRENLDPEKATKFIHAFGITEKGNFGDGKSVPIRNINLEDIGGDILEAKKIILSLRENKEKPTVDKKIITVWNALLIRGFTDSARAFNRKEWLEKAIILNDWMTENLFDKDGGISSIYYNPDHKSCYSFIDDYAIWAESLLDLSSISEWVRPGSSKKLINMAQDLALTVIKKFKDEKFPGYFFNKVGQNNSVPVRKKFWYDNAIPSANSSILRVFATLYHLTGNQTWLEELKEARAAYPKLCLTAPQGVGHALAAITEDAVGISSIQCEPEKLDETICSLAKYPYRPIFVNPLQNKDEKISRLKIKDQLIENKQSSIEPVNIIYS